MHSYDLPVVGKCSVGPTCRNGLKAGPFAVSLFAVRIFTSAVSTLSRNNQHWLFLLYIIVHWLGPRLRVPPKSRVCSPATHVDVFCSRQLGLRPPRDYFLQPHQQLDDGHGVSHLQRDISKTEADSSDGQTNTGR